METSKLVVEKTADRLMKYITQNNLKVGDRLPDNNDLAKLFNVEPGTIVEAVKLLASHNILKALQESGIFVVDHRLSMSDDPLGLTFINDKLKLTFDLIDIRLIIEPRIAAMAANSATSEDIAEMRKYCQQVENLYLAGEDHTSKDLALHTKIAESSRNLVAPNLVPIIQQAISMVVHITNKQLEKYTIDTHRAIVDAIEAHDPLAASDAMMLHIIHNRDYLRKKYKNKY